MATFDKETLWAELDLLGEDRVRANLATKAYGEAGHKRALVEEWLRVKDQAQSVERESRRDASQAEQIDIARSAKDAAWEAAKAAREANRIANQANTIAKIAAVIAIAAAVGVILVLFD